jgi:hypothetical protein
MIGIDGDTNAQLMPRKTVADYWYYTWRSMQNEVCLFLSLLCSIIQNATTMEHPTVAHNTRSLRVDTNEFLVNDLKTKQPRKQHRQKSSSTGDDELHDDDKQAHSSNQTGVLFA